MKRRAAVTVVAIMAAICMAAALFDALVIVARPLAPVFAWMLP
jgi:hypothetical protein